jgi:ubiquitin carboxyl-terminal hydrolase 36/42
MRERTVVERVFGGMLCSAVTCRSCGAVSRTLDTFEDLSLELQSGVSSVEDALTAFTHPERLDEANKYKCGSCQQLTAAEKRITVAKVRHARGRECRQPLSSAAQAPNVLVVHLKRFNALGGKINRPVAFEETLSLQPHMPETDEGAHYSLYSVVVHDGFSGASGVRCRATIWR